MIRHHYGEAKTIIQGCCTHSSSITHCNHLLECPTRQSSFGFWECWRTIPHLSTNGAMAGHLPAWATPAQCATKQEHSLPIWWCSQSPEDNQPGAPLCSSFEKSSQSPEPKTLVQHRLKSHHAVAGTFDVGTSLTCPTFPGTGNCFLFLMKRTNLAFSTKRAFWCIQSCKTAPVRYILWATTFFYVLSATAMKQTS